MPESASGVDGLDCDLLVFDLDGTLIDSQTDLANAVNATLTHLDRPVLGQDCIAGLIGDGASMLLSRSLEHTGFSSGALLARALPYFLDYYREHRLDTTYVYPGVLAELSRIRKVAPKLPMAVLTNKPMGPSVAICEGLGLAPFFFANYGGDSFPTKKPDPLGLHTLMREASTLCGRSISPARTVLVGDSHVDVETARAAGTLVLGCTYGLSPERLRAAKPDAMVDRPSDWISALIALLRAYS